MNEILSITATSLSEIVLQLFTKAVDAYKAFLVMYKLTEGVKMYSFMLHHSVGSWKRKFYPSPTNRAFWSDLLEVV